MRARENARRERFDRRLDIVDKTLSLDVHSR